jgi:T-complex protein 1 subunit eta
VRDPPPFDVHFLLLLIGQKVTISNDGATIINLLDIVHPAAKTLVDIAKSQDDEVGDGTTSVTLLAGEFLKNVKVKNREQKPEGRVREQRAQSRGQS